MKFFYSFALIIGLLLAVLPAQAQDVNQLRLARAASLIREGEELVRKGERLTASLSSSDERAMEEARRYITDGRAKIALGEKLQSETQAQIDYERRNDLSNKERAFKLEFREENFGILILEGSRDILQSLWQRNYDTIYYNHCYVDKGKGWQRNQAATQLIVTSLMEADAARFTVSPLSDLRLLIEDENVFLTSPEDPSLGNRDDAAIIYSEIIHPKGADFFYYAIRAINAESRTILYSEVTLCPLDQVLATRLELALPEEKQTSQRYNVASLRDVTGFIGRMSERGSSFVFTTAVSGDQVFPYSRLLPLSVKQMIYKETLLPLSDTVFLGEVLTQPNGQPVSTTVPENAQWLVEMEATDDGQLNRATLTGINKENDMQVSVGPLELKSQ